MLVLFQQERTHVMTPKTEFNEERFGGALEVAGAADRGMWTLEADTPTAL